MAFIKIYIFDTIEKAEKAIQVINLGEGIPVNDEATTRTYCKVQQVDGLIFINADEITKKYINEVVEYEPKNTEDDG